MKRLFVLAALTASLVACNPAGRSLVILHCNDTHSHLDPLRTGQGGVIERAAFVDSVRKARGEGNVMLLHGGDFSQGSSYFTLLKGDLEIDLINALGYDCVCLGNHEFDNGIEELGRRLSSIKCPVVCANYDFSPFVAGKYISPYAIVSKAGRKVGIIGLLTDLSTVVDRNIVDRLPYLGPDAEVTNKWSRYLRDEMKCDLVLVLSHLGYEEDVKLSGQLHGVDAIVGGHSHTFLDEMSVCQDADGKDIVIVQDGNWGREMGELTFD